MADRFLSNNATEVVIEPGDQNRLIKKIREAIDEVSSSPALDTKTRWDLIRRLRAVEDAVLSVRLRGSDEVEAATDSLVSMILRGLT
ncbi:hypothetical protein [Nocardioides lianchengensis]|uniref:Uncharacterized protein n=1 Tax=Nocardioides lianchengensis TaxID=1045774 RepID=A0A1G6JV49_9ACTN|nr:hypothetical protein [Nocardioides lianchengensis]NYG08769.1 DNA-binding PucR family transcriptional regulator [Nocardioides lianchengensis]SDC21866.1 hypothetical protein SAMN05421872_101573 [Nocardioides lianchengensis]